MTATCPTRAGCRSARPTSRRRGKRPERPAAPSSGGRPAGGARGRGPRGRGRARPPAGSCITLVITDAPLDAASCSRLARRAGLGLARTGSTASHGRGGVFVAPAPRLAAPRRGPRPPPPAAGGSPAPFSAGVVEATEEAVLTGLLAAPTVTGRAGHTSYGLPA